MIFFFVSLGHHLSCRGNLRTLILTLKEKLGVDVADNEGAWNMSLLKDDDDYELDFEIELDIN